ARIATGTAQHASIRAAGLATDLRRARVNIVSPGDGVDVVRGMMEQEPVARLLGEGKPTKD
ncbi:MAG TPA: hypothetical protein VMB05_06150, partial [Solirubrobacteraceae bacterium]|nr:hypothetical protein [Solirubrobacteraceae bacterium]